MAAVQLPQPPGSFPTKPESREGRPQWDYSAPPNSESQAARKPSVDGASHKSNHPQDHSRSVPGQMNGSPAQANALPRTSQSTNDTSDDRLLPPPSILGRTDSYVSRGGSENDSLLDLYGPHSANRSRVGSMEFGEKRPSNDTSVADEHDPESSRWIHRDKLLRIESEELQRAGINIGLDGRPGSRHVGRRERERSNDAQTPGSKEQGQETISRQEKRQRVVSPIRAEEAEEGEDDGEPMSFDLRTPEEIAADPYEQRDGHTPYGHSRWATSNTSHSRIPLPKSSPLPIPQDYIARNAPLQRRASGEDQGIAYKNTSRSRSLSLSSQKLLDEGDAASPATPSTTNVRSTPPTSPSKGKGHGSRKASISRAGEKKPLTRPPNRDSPATRPTTRSGEVKRPEGDPPWMASMYKPDPRLPPDQQLLPTVAKRLQQEQWEREGKFGEMYDRELNPISVHSPENENGHYQQPDSESDYQDDPPKPEAAASPKPQALGVPPGGAGEASEWPLRRSRGSIGRPGTSGTEHGGYKTMPTVRDPQASPNSPMIQTMKVHDAEDGEGLKKEKGGMCACCIVM